jgi:hypothetical protein
MVAVSLSLLVSRAVFSSVPEISMICWRVAGSTAGCCGCCGAAAAAAAAGCCGCCGAAGGSEDLVGLPSFSTLLTELLSFQFFLLFFFCEGEEYAMAAAPTIRAPPITTARFMFLIGSWGGVSSVCLVPGMELAKK